MHRVFYLCHFIYLFVFVLVLQLMLLCHQKHGQKLPTLVMMLRVTLAFIKLNIVIRKPEAVSLCLSEIGQLANFSVGHAYYDISVVKISLSNDMHHNYYWCQ